MNDRHPDTGNPRPNECCGACPPIKGGGWDCTCPHTPTCPPKGPTMVISDEAIEAAAKALAYIEPGEDWPSNTDLGGHAILGTRDDEFKWAMEQDAERALTAALPHIEAALRKQIAADLRTKGNTYPTHSERRGAWHSAARIASEAAERALREAATDMRSAKDPGHWNLRVNGDPEHSASPDAWLEYRADRLRAERGEQIPKGPTP